ncbi:MAG: glycosyltransferase [Bradyrhizobium sp.]|uniref:glycosyltransferase n=1 Tax=Bradyrhizobium sp. TaxID=376 RepID=UPI00120A2217|nr:glycosyltransferase [Bradyrhizobium sp.]THD72497.1 MAG: glycosyltransferase [Bradyrhizobium sp.]
MVWLLGGILVSCALVEAFELIELQAASSNIPAIVPPPGQTQPFVSFHVPICSEPPEVVARTLRALDRLEYDSFEVLVIDNNTQDEQLWRPIEALCRELGPRFRFFHLENCPGFKAGALNFGLQRTAEAAVLIGVVDADYETVPKFLAELVGYFSEPEITFVQTPQDYRDWSSKPFSRMCYWEYWQVFAISMLVRSRHNAILMHGTMSLIRKDAIARAGGWAEWCLTEDSELGLRLLGSGSRSVYTTKTYGRGLVPFTFRDYKRQRRRWVIGGVQQIKRHLPIFLSKPSHMTAIQKFEYIRGWLLWFRDAVIVCSIPVLLLAAAGILAGVMNPHVLAPLSIGLFAVVLQIVIRHLIVYRVCLSVNWRDAFGAMVANCSLTWTVGCAYLVGSTTADQVFQRTPKRPHSEPSWISSVRAEALVGAMMLALAVAVGIRYGAGGWVTIVAMLCYAWLLLSAPFMAWRAAIDASS